jgi:two-component system, OmpR family, sensor histidine kinase SenX3
VTEPAAWGPAHATNASVGRSTIGSVNPEVIALLAGLVGLFTGVFAVLAFQVSERQQRADTGPPPVSALPPGVADVLTVLRSSAVVLDTDDTVVRASPAAYAFGLVRNDRIMATDLLELVHRVRRDGEIREAELDLPRGSPGGGSSSVLARVAPLGSTLVLLLVDDRTEAKRVDAVRRDFLANVSHELKTPVGAMALLAEALLDAADDPDAVRRFAARMQKESGRLTELVQDVIDLSRLQGHDSLRSAELVPLDDVVREAVDRSRLAAEAKSIAIAVGASDGLVVRGDSQQLVMALGNLVDNAVRHSPCDTRVSLAVRRVEDGPVAVAEVTVSDEGPGIPDADGERIFERFYRVDAARSRDTGGTGLGLAIVKHVALGHGGEVTVWSAEGAGSTFTLRLPVAPVVKEESA